MSSSSPLVWIHIAISPTSCSLSLLSLLANKEVEAALDAQNALPFLGTGGVMRGKVGFRVVSGLQSSFDCKGVVEQAEEHREIPKT